MSGKKGRNEYRKNALTKKLAYGLGILVLFVFISYFAISLSTRPQEYVPPPSELKAAIIDQLSLSLSVEENLTKTFKETASNILKQANFTVYYYSGEKVTVDFYRNLPLQNFKIIILRVHSTTEQKSGGTSILSNFTVLFTAELYDKNKYSEQQRTLQLVKVYYTPYREGDLSYFGITQYFVKWSMRGSFSNAITILMGCQGLSNQEAAKAFVEKGAKVYISWNASVSAPHTDLATIHLLQHLVIEKQNVETAVNEVDPDPEYQSQLMFYPPEAGSYIIQNLISNSQVDIAQIKRKNLSFYHFVLCDL